jgi:hypothetical protein
MMAVARRYCDFVDITDARCYCGSPINKLLRDHIAMLLKFSTKDFCSTVIWHMTSPARCYYDRTHLSVIECSL